MEYKGVHMMRSLSDCGSSATHGIEEEMVIRKGPWTEEEDSILINYITVHGEGHWNSLARCAGLKRTGKSCRLRWLNYLRPNVRHGNITLQEQLLILDLHSRWGNRWSKIAEHMPGRTDNEIKNYWRTRVVKQAKQLKCDVNSKQFRDALRFVWMPRLLERIQASHSGNAQSTIFSNNTQAHSDPCGNNPTLLTHSAVDAQSPSPSHSSVCYNLTSAGICCDNGVEKGPSPTSCQQMEVESSAIQVQAFEANNGFGGADLWTDENIWFLQQQLADEV